MTAGTAFHRTRTPLHKWFAAAWLIGQDKRGVSALFLARELALRYDTAWLMAHKLRHGLSERPEYLLDGLIEIAMGAGFRANTDQAGISNARLVEGDWLTVDPPVGTVALVNHVTISPERSCRLLNGWSGPAAGGLSSP